MRNAILMAPLAILLLTRGTAYIQAAAMPDLGPRGGASVIIATAVLGSAPSPAPPNPAPVPAPSPGACRTCGGSSWVTHGDGHRTDCPDCPPDRSGESQEIAPSAPCPDGRCPTRPRWRPFGGLIFGR